MKRCRDMGGKCYASFWQDRCRCTRSTKKVTKAAARGGAGGSPSASTKAASGPGSSLQQASLSLHNAYRRRHGVPDLAWSAKVAKSAQAHADRCVFAHSYGTGYGENLAW